MIDDLLGKPWKSGAYGPTHYDCWGLVWAVQDRLGAVVPQLEDTPQKLSEIARTFRDTDIRDNLVKLDGPQHGAIVEMAHSTRPYHVGVYLDYDRGGILHSIGKLGVQWDTLQSLKGAGWNHLTYYAVQ